MTIQIQGLAPLLQVFDMPTSLAFYRDLLGFRMISSSPPPQYNWVLLELDGVQLMLNTAYEDDSRPPAPDPARIASHADTGIYFSCPDVDAAYAHVRAAGLEVKPPVVTSYRFKSLELVDPDGYLLHFHWPEE